MTSKRKRQDEDGEKENEGSPRQKRTRSGQADLVKGKERGTPTSAMKAPETPSKRPRGRPPGSGKKHGSLVGAVEPQSAMNAPEIPSKRPRGRPRGSGKKPGSLVGTVEPQSAQDTPNSKFKGKVLFETPTKPREGVTDTSFPLVRNADRSARRKSARIVIKQTIADDLSEDNESDEDDLLARQIWDAAEAEDGIPQNEVGNEFAGESTAPDTPSKPGRRQRKGARRKKTTTPPQDLPAHEQYFFQNRPGNTKTSNNTLSSLSLLTHGQYHDQVSAYVDPHESSIAYLHSLHSRSFPQWRFELSQSFNICLYGYGSKRQLVTSFASYLHEISPSSPPQIMIVNGYTSTLTLRQILTTLATLVFSCTPSTLPSHLGIQSQSMISAILAHLHSSPASPPIRLFINSLDAPLLRRAPNPALLAQLAASPQIHIVATCDTPSFPLLWDISLREQYKWLFHDTTTFRSYAPIEVGNVINDVNELLGRSGRSVKGREGVGFVLRSLPENARNLYRLLIAELLATMDSDANGLNDDLGDDELEDLNENLGRSSRKGRRSEASVEYAVLRQKVEEEFICSSEMAFRQLLKEFYDHQMVVSRRNGAGTEMLGVPFRREEIEAILEDLLDE